MTSAAIAIEILMHLEDEFVGGIRECAKVGVSAADPRPSATPAGALGSDPLRSCTSGTDAVDSCLVEVEDEGLVHFVVFVVSVEHYCIVILEWCSDFLPPALEASGVSDDGAVEAAVVVGLDHSVGALAGDVIDSLSGLVSG